MKRDLYWDSLKAILIFLVVYGHAISPYVLDSTFNQAMYNSIYLFHMPLFIIISGRFSHMKDKKKYIRGIIRLFETFVVFQIIRTVCSVSHGAEFTLKGLFCTKWIMWYLLSLTYWRLTIYFIPEKWLCYHKSIIAISLIISITIGFVPIHSFLGIQSTLAFLPFFVFGFYSVEIDIWRYINSIPKNVAIGVLLAIFCFFYFVLNTNLTFVYSCHPYWTDDFFHTFIHLGARCVYIPLGFVSSIMVMRLTPTNIKLAEWGLATLFIFIYHSFALREFLFLLIDRGCLPSNEWYLLIYSIIVFGGLLLLSRVKVFNILLNPISYCKENHNSSR